MNKIINEFQQSITINISTLVNHLSPGNSINVINYDPLIQDANINTSLIFRTMRQNCSLTGQKADIIFKTK